MNTPLILMAAAFATSVIALTGWWISHSNAKYQARQAQGHLETAQYYSTLNDDLMDQLDALDKANAANRAKRDAEFKQDLIDVGLEPVAIRFMT